MRPRGHLRLLCALFVLALVAPVRAQSAPGFTWWRDARVQKELGLTADQSNRIDAVFRAALPHQRQRKDELDAQEAELSHLIVSDADEATIGRQSDQVEAIRADLNKTRTLMLVHIRQLLSPEQRAKLTMLHEQREQQRDHDQGNRDHGAPHRDSAR
jgi:Spy/CpxP family protein refolding chaperone